MTLRGTVVNGKVELHSGATLPEGTVVRVEPLKRSRASPRRSRGTDLLALAKGAVKTGLSDLASEHDHYAYGTPKRRSAKPRRRAG